MFRQRDTYQQRRSGSTPKYQTLLVLALIFLTCPGAYGQTHSVSVRASAQVIELSELEMITIQEFVIDEGKADGAGKIRVKAQTDPEAGKMLIKGRPGDYIRINFEPQLLLQNTEGRGNLTLNYEIYGFSSDNSMGAEPFPGSERVVQINSQGEYFLWVGGSIDISQAQPGSYNGEFTFEIEYVD